MDESRSPRWTRLWRAEIDRRRALVGLVGVAALGLTGRRAAAGEAPPYIRPFDLARAALQPSDVPGGDNLEKTSTGNRTFEGLSGAFESGVLAEEDFAALEQAGVLQELIAGHGSTLEDAERADRRYFTTAFQFASVTAARAAFDALASLARATFDEITPSDDRSRFFRDVYEADNDVYDDALVIFRRMDIVVAIACEMEILDDEEEATDAETIEALRAMSEAVGDRVSEIVGGDYDGVGANLPTPAEFSGRAGSLVPTGRGWREETYTVLDGMKVGPAQGPTVGFPPVDDDGAGIEEAVCRQEEIHTYEGKKVVLGLQVRRFASVSELGDFLVRAMAGGNGASWSGGGSFRRLPSMQSTDNEVEVEAIDPPAAPAGTPFLPGVLAPEWTANRFSYKDRDLYGVTAWVANDRDLIGVQVAGVPTDGAESVLTEALGQWVWMALGLYELAGKLDGLPEQEVETRWRSLYDLSPDLCNALTALDFLD